MEKTPMDPRYAQAIAELQDIKRWYYINYHRLQNWVENFKDMFSEDYPVIEWMSEAEQSTDYFKEKIDEAIHYVIFEETSALINPRGSFGNH